jgi:hypothetical protein
MPCFAVPKNSLNAVKTETRFQKGKLTTLKLQLLFQSTRTFSAFDLWTLKAQPGLKIGTRRSPPKIHPVDFRFL